MANLAVIPARGGSKRIPRKNIREFLGKPIIAYSIELALSSGLFKEVIVSTDDTEIAEVSTRYGASVPFIRNEITSGDFATLADVREEVRQYYLEKEKKFNYMCCVLPTAPLSTIENMNKGLQILIGNHADSVRPVVRFSYPVQRAVRMNDGKIEMFYPEYQSSRSQDLEPCFHDAGQFYWMKFETGLFGKNKLGFEIPGLFVQDIDNEEDWLLAELKYQLLKKTPPSLTTN